MATTPILDPPDRPTWVDRIDNPYLHGIHAPTVHETTAVELPVEGELPADLCGAYLRNGPNQVFEPTNLYHWFARSSCAFNASSDIRILNQSS